MPIARTITLSERFGVWKAWSGRCFWCREPVYFKDCHIDHLLPLSAAGELADLITRYSLPSNFELDDYENWIPAHASCNQRKGDVLIDPSPAVALHFSAVRMNARVAKLIAETIDRDRRRALLLAKLEKAVSAGDITEADIQEILRGLPVVVKKAVEVPDNRIFLAPGWEIVERQGGRDTVVVRSPDS
jgi:hypothetical protein